MVKICSFLYPSDNEIKYSQHYTQFNFELHDFQKWAIESIVTGNHVLITAPTGTGKTVPAEFAINYFHSIGKKTIYTCPIKALSNEKFYDFTRKFPHINVGLVTGDISCNPNADVIIMTLEILMNKLCNNSIDSINKTTSFEMDIQNELGCVVFDEIHFINDAKRGTNWEQTMLMLPKHIQMIGLSATLDNPEMFAQWMENCQTQQSQPHTELTRPQAELEELTRPQAELEELTRPQAELEELVQVYLCKKSIRTVPLIHYSFITGSSAVNKKIKDKVIQQEIQQMINKPLIIQNEKNIFNDVNYQKINKILNIFSQNDIRINRRPVLNALANYLVENEMLPALCYVFSRKQLEICAEELTANLLEFDSKVPYVVDYECEQILRKLPNYQEYLQLPEYVKSIQLFRKGIGMHHAGLIPILREMTELLFSKGYIKILFCTETMSIGINLPVKTTIFTDVNKFDGNNLRTLYGHEYTQASGRAGRLGLDRVGHVIHLNNLFRNVDSLSIKQMMKCNPQKLISKFNISYNLILNLINNGDDIDNFILQSMCNINISNQVSSYQQDLNKLIEKYDELNNLKKYKCSEEIICEYIDLKNKKNNFCNKKKKEIERRIQNILENNYFIENDCHLYLNKKHVESEILDIQVKISDCQNLLKNKKNIIIQKLIQENLIQENNTTETMLTPKGQIACKLREIHCLLFANILIDKNNLLYHFSIVELVAFLSCFTNIVVSDDNRENFPNSQNIALNNYILSVKNQEDEFKEFENRNGIDCGLDCNMHYDLMNYVIEWCECTTEIECKNVFNKLSCEKNIFSGEFIKSILKINNIVEELKNICENDNLEFMLKLNEIPNLTLKYIATNQSLYV
jgi:superfamily II RNA helicase